MISVSKTKLLSLALLASSSYVDAADWLSLQGVQPDKVAPKGVYVPYARKTPKVWGFIQTNYKQDLGDVQISPSGVNQTPFSLLNPDLEDQSGFNVFRARVALRGMADDENLVDYFFMTEFGNNAVNNLVGHREVATYFTDASVTLKHIPYAKLRMGMFKTPGSEEGLQAVFVSPYVEFTTMTNQQLLERQVTHVGAADPVPAKGGAAASNTHYTSTSIEQPIAAFRDTGLQVFDTIPLSETWSASYAYMYGNGNGISMKTSNKQETHYGYLAIEDNYNEVRGYYHESMKFYGWIQDGKRTLLSNDGTSTTEVNANRQRYGLGMTYYSQGLRFEAEYMKAKGMIFTGAKDKNPDPLLEDWQFQYAVGDNNTADGGYINLQYEIFPKKFEVFGRYDIMDRLPDDAKAQRKFKTATLGASYRFMGATRLDFNYAFRDASAPGNANAQKVLDNLGDRVSIQLTAAF